MSQNFTTNTPPATTSGAALATQTDNRSDALLTMHSGATRPSYAKAGTMWLQDDASPWVLYFYDGSADVQIATVDPTTHVITMADASVARLAAANIFLSQQTIRQSGEGGQLVLEEAVSGKVGNLDMIAANNVMRILHNMDGAGNEIWEFPSSTETPTANAVMRKSDLDAVAAKTDTYSTLVATTGATAVDFTSLPADIMEVDVIFHQVSFSSGDYVLVQLGTSGGIVTSGYASTSAYNVDGTTNTLNESSGMGIRVNDGNRFISGFMRFRRLEPGGTIWIAEHSVRYVGGVSDGAGRVDIAGELTQLRITRSGSNTFDGGDINIVYRG